MTTYIDVTPTWVSVCRMAIATRKKEVIKELIPACELLDKVVKAKKDGATFCTFTFNEDGSTTFSTNLDTNEEGE